MFATHCCYGHRPTGRDRGANASTAKGEAVRGAMQAAGWKETPPESEGSNIIPKCPSLSWIREMPNKCEIQNGSPPTTLPMVDYGLTQGPVMLVAFWYPGSLP